MARPLTIRSSALLGYPVLARSAGLDPARMARQAGVSREALTRPDAVVTARSAFRLLELSAAQSGVDDFGLRLAQQRGLSHLGVLGLQVRDEPDVRSALDGIVSGLNRHSSCTKLSIENAGDVAVLTLVVLPDGEPSIRQGTETALGQLFQDLVVLLGPRWRPLGVQFIHGAGQSTRTHRTLFGCPVTFGSDRNAIVMRSADLARPIHGADAGFKAFANALASVHAPMTSRISVESTQQALSTLLSQGRCTSEAVARSIGIDRRTLHRHLRAAGTDFSSVLMEMRAELAKQYLQAGLLSMTDIAILLGFSSLGSFSRWFSLRYGSAPTRWKRNSVP
jgi:AraC-like DNA-binding protein